MILSLKPKCSFWKSAHGSSVTSLNPVLQRLARSAHTSPGFPLFSSPSPGSISHCLHLHTRHSGELWLPLTQGRYKTDLGYKEWGGLAGSLLQQEHCNLKSVYPGGTHTTLQDAVASPTCSFNDDVFNKVTFGCLTLHPSVYPDIKGLPMVPGIVAHVCTGAPGHCRDESAVAHVALSPVRYCGHMDHFSQEILGHLSSTVSSAFLRLLPGPLLRVPGVAFQREAPAERTKLSACRPQLFLTHHTGPGKHTHPTHHTGHGKPTHPTCGTCKVHIHTLTDTYPTWSTWHTYAHLHTYPPPSWYPNTTTFLSSLCFGTWFSESKAETTYLRHHGKERGRSPGGCGLSTLYPRKRLGQQTIWPIAGVFMSLVVQQPTTATSWGPLPVVVLVISVSNTMN